MRFIASLKTSRKVEQRLLYSMEVDGKLRCQKGFIILRLEVTFKLNDTMQSS